MNTVSCVTANADVPKEEIYVIPAADPRMVPPRGMALRQCISRRDEMVTQKSDCALITGSSTGIGAIYADRPARRGFDPILVARNRNGTDALAERLVEETGQSVEVAAADHRATYRGIDFWRIVIWAGLLLAGAIGSSR
jgi:hypothetical protein